MKSKFYLILLGSALLLLASGRTAKSVVHNSRFQSDAARNSQAQPCVDRSSLIFTGPGAESAESRWCFSGYIVVTGTYEGSEENDYYRVMSNSGHTWLILREQPRIGTGVRATNEMWYKIDQGPPEEVLNYPLRGGRAMGLACDLEYRADVADASSTAGPVTQAIRYSVSFGALQKPGSDWLFSQEKR